MMMGMVVPEVTYSFEVQALENLEPGHGASQRYGISLYRFVARAESKRVSIIEQVACHCFGMLCTKSRAVVEYRPGCKLNSSRGSRLHQTVQPARVRQLGNSRR